MEKMCDNYYVTLCFKVKAYKNAVRNGCVFILDGKKVLVDGHYGTINLNLKQMISKRNDLEIIWLENTKQVSAEQRAALINSADIVIMCQSAETAVNTMPLITSLDVKVIDTSNAFRLSSGWVYGLPELGRDLKAGIDQRKKIAEAKRVSLPAPIAVGAAMLINPLIKGKIMAPHVPLYLNCVVGYSSGGANMISLYEDPGRPRGYSSARQYALDQTMLQQKEIMHACGVSYRPSINPMIDDYPNGILVTAPMHLRTLQKRLHSRQIWEAMARFYEKEPLIEVVDFDSAVDSVGGFLDAGGMAGSNKVQIFVFGDNDICLLAARFDNLGKGGAGAVIQNMNLMLGLDEFLGVI